MTWEIREGHVLDVLRQMDAESVQAVVTSPPYWGLRDYGLEPQVWGGEDCEHEWGGSGVRQSKGYGATSSLGHGTDGSIRRSERGLDQDRAIREFSASTGALCLHCNAWRGSLGLEPTPDLYVEHMVQVFREVRRVLRKDGTVWLNLGDSYVSTAGSLRYFGEGGKDYGKLNKGEGRLLNSERQRFGKDDRPWNLKPKDLCGIPWRVAFALQADGWWLRSDIIWSKPNPMPESVTDRPTRAHEYLFLLTRSSRYFYDADAVREPQSQAFLERVERTWNPSSRNSENKPPKETARWRVEKLKATPTGRNLRSVWNIPTEPFPEAHFATFPKKLVEPCVKAGTSEKGCCSECGAPWVREVERELVPTRGRIGDGKRDPAPHYVQSSAQHAGGVYGRYKSTTRGFHPNCPHDTTLTPCTVLDPFCGSGTVGVVALRHGRNFIGIELSETYAEMARNRITDDAPLFNVIGDS